MECGVFKRVQIVTQPLGGSSLAWGLRPGFKAKGPFHFYVDFGRSGSDEWETLNLSPLVDGCMFFDDKQRHYDQLADFYYRVRLVLPNEPDPATGGCRVHLSQPHQANGLWSKRDWLIAREVCRKEYLMQRKRTNQTAVGFLFKRRRYGQPCSRCIEFDTGEVQSKSCAECHGTGFTGGYFQGVDFRITMNAPWSRKFKPDQTLGTRNDLVRTGRAVAYPYVDKYDIYWRRDTGERFIIHTVESLAEVGGIPVVVGLELRLAPVTDVVYNVPASGGSSSAVSSSSPAPAACDWRTGLKLENDW
jgi:hypothetical protein